MPSYPIRILNPNGPIPGGDSSYKELINEGCCLVDKSLLIKELQEDKNRVIIIIA